MSPVIGTILMVAITVMLASGVYVWTTLFAGNQDVPEQVSVRGIIIDQDNDGQVGWIRVTMTSADNDPYSFNVVKAQLITPQGDLAQKKENILCATPQHTGQACTKAAEGSWELGESLYMPCFDTGDHMATLTIRTSTVLDDRFRCDQSGALDKPEDG